MRKPTTHIDEPLDARVIAGRRYVLEEPFVVYSAVIGAYLHIPAGFEFNGHSVPRPLWWWAPTDDWLEAACVHDWLYKQGRYFDPEREQYMTLRRRRVDQVYYDLLRHVGCPRRRALVLHAGVRVGGWVSWRDYRKRQKQGEIIQ